MSGYVSGPASCPPSICADVSAYWNICCLLLTDHLLAELMKCSRCWDNPALDCHWHRKHFPLRFHFYPCFGMAAPPWHELPHPCLFPPLVGGSAVKIQVTSFLANVKGCSRANMPEINCWCHGLGGRGRNTFWWEPGVRRAHLVVVRKFVWWDCDWHHAETPIPLKMSKVTQGIFEPRQSVEDDRQLFPFLRVTCSVIAVCCSCAWQPQIFQA